MGKYIFVGLLVLGVLLGLGWVVAGNQLAMNKIFLPANEAVRRETFEQSKAYRQGLVQELQNMQFQYIQTDNAHKEALGTLIKHRAADVDPSILPPDLYSFIRSLP
jgi:hypothetical protein